MRKLRKNDEVIVLTGKYKQKKGVILKIIDDGKRAIVEGINIIKKHMKPNPNKQQEGGIIEREAPIQVSNLAILNKVTDKADRVAVNVLEDGRRVRCYKSSGELIDEV